MGGKLRRFNFPGVAAAIIALVSIFVPWWGIVTTGTNPANNNDVMYFLLGPPSRGNSGNLDPLFNQLMATYAPLVLALALVTIAMTLLGCFNPTTSKFLWTSLAVSLLTVVGFAGLVGYALPQKCNVCTRENCQGGFCVQGVMGSIDLMSNPSIIITWGFQVGFYFFLGGAAGIVIALAYHSVIRNRNGGPALYSS